MEKQQIDYAEFKQERIINIPDMITELVRKIWIIILAASVFAVLFCGYKYVKDSRAVQTENLDVVEDLEENLTLLEQEEVNNILVLQEDVECQQEYLSNSVLMQINAYNEDKMTLQYYLNVESEAYSNKGAVINAYKNYIESGALANDLKAKGVSLEQQYLNELISVNIEDTVGVEANSLIDQSGIFSVEVIHQDKEKCCELAEQVAQCIEEYSPVVGNAVGPHMLTLFEQNYSRVNDKNLWNYKSDRISAIEKEKEQVELLKSQLTQGQLTVLNGDMSSDENVQNDIQESVSFSKKFLVLGGGVGIVLAILFIFICYIMRGTINTSSELQCFYNIRILGELHFKEEKNIFLVAWRKLTGKGQIGLTLNDEKEMLLSNLRVTCEKANIKKLLIGSDAEVSLDEEWLKAVVEGLKEDGIEVSVESELLKSSMAFEKMAMYGNIVLVEELKKSKYENTTRQIKMCMEQKACILGTIVLG